MIKCKNVYLQSLEESDIPELYDLIVSNEMGQAFDTTYHEVTLKRLPAILCDTDPGTQVKVFVIKKDKELIGFIALSNIEPIKRSGYISALGMKKKYRSKVEDGFLGASYTMEAAGALIIYAFEVLNLHKLYAHTFSDNSDVDRLYKTGNWKVEGVIREFVPRNGKWLDRIDWGLLKKEYKECDDYKALKKYINWR